MRYVYGNASEECRTYGHTWPKLEEFNRVTRTVKTRRFPLWRRLLGRPQVCRRCGTRRFWS